MRNKKNMIMYILGILVSVLLITVAFLGPGIVFGIQDGIRCRDIVAVSQEKLDVTSFNTGYERNLYRRLERFAEGVQQGKQYYVTTQDMEQDQEVVEWLESDWYNESAATQMLGYNLGLLPVEELYTYSLIRWKRCVIYGEDFSEGVNFILWYIELGQNEETFVKLLVDGETGDLYAVRTNFDSLFQDMEKYIYSQENLLDLFDVTDEFFWYLYINLGEEYGGLDISEKVNWLEENGVGYHGAYLENENALQIEVETEEIMAEQPYRPEPKQYNVEEITDYMRHLQWQIKEDEIKFSFPYGEKGEYNLDFYIHLNGEIRSFTKWGTRFADMVFGFPEIYERIPGFTED